MAQKRKPPAYQEYAASMLSDKKFRLMSLAERGLLYTMRLESWENIQTLANPSQLAKYLGFSLEEIQSALTENVKLFFMESNDFFTCPELDNYRQLLEERNLKQINGGKKGAKIRDSGKNNSKNIEKSNSSNDANLDWREEYENADNAASSYKKTRGE